jgi:signal transduction histidine kinase/ligand-binding sensor domain-containing protein
MDGQSWRERKVPPKHCALAILALLLIFSIRMWAERLPMRLYTTEDGLWSGFINRIMRDSHGFMWFCTRDGLSRFDGYRFTNYRIAGGPASENFTYIFETRDGMFWITVADNLIYRYDPRSATASTLPSQSNSPDGDDGRVLLNAQLVASQKSLWSFVEDRQGDLWAAGAGLTRIERDGDRVFFREINLNLPQAWRTSFQVRTLQEGDDGSLWLATSHGLLRRLPDGRVRHYYVGGNPTPEEVRFFLADKSGFVWAVLHRKLYIFKPEPISSLSGQGVFASRELPAHRVTSQNPLPTKSGDAADLDTVELLGGSANKTEQIYQEGNGRIWLVTRNKLVLFDGRQFHSFADPTGNFAGVIEDLDDDLWITTHRGGVLRFSVRGFTSYTQADGLGDQDIASIHEDPGGHLQVVSRDWWISRLNGATFRSIRPNIPEATMMWTSNLGFLDHTGQWWLLTRRGLYRFLTVRQMEDLARVTPQRYTNLAGLPGQWAYCMFEDSRGDLWISVRDYEDEQFGLLRWSRRDESFHRFTEAEGLQSSKSASSFAEDRAGNLWFGFYEGGLARYTAGRFTTFTPADGLPQGFITSLHVDGRGRLWLTSSTGGLAQIDDPTAEHPIFIRHTTREGLSTNNARAITEDLNGDIYVGTVRGVDRLSPDSGTIRHYGLADGLAGDFVTTAYRDRKGTLWFGTFGGLSSLVPQREPVAAPPPIRIEGLRIAGVAQSLSEFGATDILGLTLSAAQSNLQIDFATLSMARAALLRYQYKLEGVDDEWSAPTDQRTVHYANLAPGSYRFLVRAIDPSGLSSPQPATLAFRILPPFWQRWWFLALLATVMGGTATLLYRYRVNQLLQLERVRTHIATDLHDDIGSSLSQIAVLSEVVRRQLGGTNEVSQPLSTIATTSRELVDSMSDIVWAINPNRDNLGDLVQRMRRFASDLFTANEIELRFNARESERPVKLDAEVRRQVFLIFKESAHNIVRHAECSRVDIDIHIENHAITLTLKDDGRGFAIAHAGHGHGLSSMVQRAKILGGTLEIDSHPGHGSSVALRVPLARRAAAGQ